jgi:hypothetical protein
MMIRFVLIMMLSAFGSAFLKDLPPMDVSRKFSSSLHAETISKDSSTHIAAGTPFARPKICDSITDAIGGTPMVYSVILA